MNQTEELLNSLDENEIAAYSADSITEPHIIIGADRFITVPDELKRIAVQFDHNVETVTFDCPRYWDEHDMSTMAVYINYMLPNQEMGSYPASNVRVDELDDSLIHFDWTVSGNVTRLNGNVAILICVKNTNEEGNVVTHWSSELNRDMYVSEGMDCSEVTAELDSDVVTQLLLRMDSVEEALNGASGLTVDQSYVPTSPNAQSGKAVTQAVMKKTKICVVDSEKIPYSEDSTISIYDNEYGGVDGNETGLWYAKEGELIYHYGDNKFSMLNDVLTFVNTTDNTSYQIINYKGLYVPTAIDQVIYDDDGTFKIVTGSNLHIEGANQLDLESIGKILIKTDNGIWLSAYGNGTVPIHNLAAPTEDNDAANKVYVDGAITKIVTVEEDGSLNFEKDGRMMANMPPFVTSNCFEATQVIIRGEPEAPTDGTNKKYVDEAVGDIESALDAIIAIQEQLINGGGTE